MSDKKIQCEINGQKISAKEGASVISAFQSAGQDICHYCWHPGLSVAGVCRLCMVEIEGQNKLQIACNTELKEGMKINSRSKKVQEAVRWGLEYHLINHPLDCPICDQAGECGLQDQYMKFGSYSPSMAENKVKKRKVISLGSKIVLDTERCILCSRCVRFTDEVSKTGELGIFDRGDRSEIGVFDDKPLENNYALNTVDICPVGALTSKDFRFRQRVWYMKTAPSVCSGCSTACNIFVDYNEEALWRVRPRFNPKINGHWMCDEGRKLYQNSARGNRLKTALCGAKGEWQSQSSKKALQEIKNLLGFSAQESSKKPSQGAPEPFDLCFILTGQYMNEEYQALKDGFPKARFYHWISNEDQIEDFDGLLLRGDRNPNTRGLKAVFPNIQPVGELAKSISSKDAVFVLGPENPQFYPDQEEKTGLLAKAGALIWMSVKKNSFLPPLEGRFQIPMKSSFEKTGSYTNHKGLIQKIEKIKILNLQAVSVEDCVKAFKAVDQGGFKRPYSSFKQNQFLDNSRRLW